jgi:DNA transformation protein and related proteins
MKDATFVEFVLEQLGVLDGVSARAMFGGHGLYRKSVFFGIVHRGRLYFRVSDDTRAEYEARGMKPFRPNPRQRMQRYYEVPVEVLEDRSELARWAERSASARPPKRRAKPRGGGNRRAARRLKR